MNKLEELRKNIDQIDDNIIKLFIERMDVVKEVIAYKIENNIPILDSSRESKMVEKNMNKVRKEEYKKYYISILEGFLKASKDLQKDILESHKN